MQGMGSVLEIEMILAGNISGTDILGNPMMSVLFCSSLHFLLQIFINFAHKSVLADAFSAKESGDAKTGLSLTINHNHKTKYL